jgi:hypothetical protein
MTAAHEIGHWIDHVGIPGNPGMNRTHKEPLFTEWMKAVKESKAVTSLKEARDIARAGGQKTKYLDYLLQSNEVWARSYAQWIAVRSGDPVMLKQLAEFKTAAQWSDKDFAPIAAAIDGIFRALGLLL